METVETFVGSVSGKITPILVRIKPVSMEDWEVPRVGSMTHTALTSTLRLLSSRRRPATVTVEAWPLLQVTGTLANNDGE